MRHKTTKYLLTLLGLIITLTASADVEININTTYSPDASFETQEYDSRFDASNNCLTNEEMAPSKEDYSKMYLTIESLEDGNIIYWYGGKSGFTRTISASTDNGQTWTAYTATSGGTQMATLNTGDKVFIKGLNDIYFPENYTNFSNTGGCRFRSSKRYIVYGNIMSLVDGDNFIGSTSMASRSFRFLFFNNGMLISAENLVLPATTLSQYCYNGMFYSCSSLTTAPELPATTLANNCYADMFASCSDLTTAPELPATTLANYCYLGMFWKCISLTTAPILSATTLAEGCYSNMFNGCTSLITAPELPATTLANSCYVYMFERCTSLTTAPVLSATTLVDGCYGYMFESCTSLNSITCLATNISAFIPTSSWLKGVSASGTFTKAASMNDWTTGDSGIPTGWTVQNAGIEVNATNFPDAEFRSWIMNNISGASDGWLTDAEIAKVTTISCSNKSIKSLKGIEFFTALTNLWCNDNQLTVLDISKNINLKDLRCVSNRLKTLDVSNNIALTWLECYYNELTSLDVNKNIALTHLDFGDDQLTTIDVSKNTKLTYLRCGNNMLTSLDVSHNTALTSLWCHSNQLLYLDLSKNTSLTSSGSNTTIITPQATSLTAVDVTSGIAITVPSEFDFTKVSNLKLAGTSVSGTITTINGQKFLVFAQTGTSGYSIDGKKLTYTYSTGNSFSEAASMDVTVSLSYDAPKTYTLSIQSGSGGSVSYDGTTVTNTTKSFTVVEGSSATISISPNSGYKLSKLTVNGTNVTSSISNNQYTISNITANTSMVATFEKVPQPFSQDGINYEIESEKDHTLNVGSGEYSGHVVIPATVTHGDETWTVTGVADGAFDTPAITAITWNPSYAIGSGAFGNLTNPNLLLYVKDAAYAPENVPNVIVNGRARKIVLTDAASGNDFNCPKAFTAEEISYTHHYSMTTGIGECRGWETITLPFKVRSITHETKGALVPFKVYRGTHLPFWLYEWSASGFVEASGIEANTPYIISFPNNDYYYSDYLISGNITFSSENVTVISSSEMNDVSGKGNIFVPNYSTQEASIQIYPLNVQNDYCTHKDYYLEGSTFVQELRTVHPFEAYMTTSSNNAKSTIPIFEALPTAIPEIPTNGNYNHNNVRIFNLSGQAVMITNEMSLERALSRLPNGVYIVNGKKAVIK